MASSGNIGIANIFTPGSGVYTVTGSTVIYNSTSFSTYSLVTFTYNNLTINTNTSPDYLITTGNSITVLGNFQMTNGFFNVNNSILLTSVSTLSVNGNFNMSGGNFYVSFYQGLGILNITGDCNISGGFFGVMDDAAAPSTTVTVNGNTTISGTASLNLESTSSALGVAVFATLGNFTATSTSTVMVDFGTGTVTGNEFRIGGNFSKTGTGTFNTTSGGSANGFIFNKAGTQTFSYVGANSQYTQYVVSSGSTLQMQTGLNLLTGASPTSTFTVNSGGTLDIGTQVITAANATNPLFTLASGATIKTAATAGLASNFSGFGATRLVLSSLANYEFNGAAPQITSAFVTTPTANTVNSLTINNGTGVSLTNNINVTTVLNLTAGKLITSANTITLPVGVGAVVPTLGKIDSFVEGNVSITSNADGDVLLFPMGGGTWWGPARLVTNGATTANATNFTVKYNNTSSPLNALALPTTPEVITNVLQAYWDINKVSGGRNADVQLYWNNSLGQITDVTQLRVLHGAAVWENYGVDNTNGNASDGTAGSNAQGSIIKNGVSTFSPFTIGSISPVNPLPLTLIGFSATRKNAENVQVAWQTINEIDLKSFVIEKSIDARNFVEVGKVNAQNATTDLKNYQFNDNEKGSVYYRLRFVHNNAADEWSVVRFVSGATSSKDEKIFVYPNPLQQEVYFGIPTAMKDNKNVSIKITNVESKVIAEYRGTWQEVATQISQAHTNWAKGMYLWYIAPEGEKVQVIKVMK